MQRAAAAPAVPDIVRMAGIRFRWPGSRPFSLTIESFALAARQRVLLVGPSGTGKSTFLSLLCGIVAPQTGQLQVLGTDLTRLSNAARDHFRAEHFGIIFQMFNLLPYGSILDNVMLPLSFARQRAARAARSGPPEVEAKRLLTSLGLDAEELADHSTADLSVGQQQRVAAARALIGGPELIVADEPTSALDRDRQLAFLDLLFAEADAAAASVIMVSHEEQLGPRFDRVLRLDEIARAERSSAA
ncbi:MAG: ATP-binding cassette domain-containing protein [Hyphomicrobium sp.]|uniref:ABC transporter ATP-binding protein n=1 Tax=Hyphomicrobium sp. TaxID=82 RepID=UPI001325FF5F|nr:ATP-binding cassette domain-containing protein [Hyphomicrobium sp.]KAB2939418.1 MAG: ATP-binding cassette domain-containing protein [Hyphomicrobium sp.]MBZ0209602.1 ATP-binding cassette domain-containing protein [Hyphomicrobium sp.]